uniref:patatin-like phospholipase domain-containing protein 3 n=1 Tax=Odobenus rosmarus divergens TaxID=9708 RepID=UPI00063CA58B|nr:PREDICTED: patatin-like phospholipase domain-containing protein 3 [Odobenus rosmarus divergens]
MSLVGICNRPHPCLNLPSEELKILKFTWGHRSLESPPRAAAGRMKPEGDERLDHLRHSILPWEESILDTLSPKLTSALSKAVKNQCGYMSKICNFLPIKVMSYMVLPCTLPVESAIAVVQRLVMWLPDMPEDIRWLQWLTSSVCSRVMTQLFPISRSQTPASGQQPSPRDMKALLPSLLSNRGRS